jgi:AraC family transcriptional regulator
LGSADTARSSIASRVTRSHDDGAGHPAPKLTISSKKLRSACEETLPTWRITLEYPMKDIREYHDCRREAATTGGQVAPAIGADEDDGQVIAAARGLSPRALSRAKAYIASHMGESFSLSDLACAACISRFHFARLFRASTGRSPMEYVLNARMEAAKTMLARGDQKIAATAAALGFFDQSHFTRTFRRVTGVSPGAYSRQQPLAAAMESPRTASRR